MFQPANSSLSTMPSTDLSRSFSISLASGRLSQRLASAAQKTRADRPAFGTPTPEPQTLPEKEPQMTPPVIDPAAAYTEIQFEEIRAGDEIRITSYRDDFTAMMAGRADRFSAGTWLTSNGVALIQASPGDGVRSRVIELVSRPASDGLPQTTGSVVIATLVGGVAGEFPLFRGRAAWHSAQPIGNGWLHHDRDIQAWKPAAIVEDVLPA